MQVIHRVTIKATPDIQHELASMRVFVGKGNPIASHVVTFEVDETHDQWPAIQAWIERRKAVDLVSTRFSQREVEAARWLEAEPEWHYGYPQPNDQTFGYREVTYDLTDYCDRCGIGKKQKAPFQMKGEPKWGRRSILQLNWVFDEYFVTPQLWVNVFKPHGIKCRPVLNTKGTELETVVQLIAHEGVRIVTDGLLSEEPVCSKCGRTKYLPVARGPFPSLACEPSTAMVRTKEYFGSGASAYQGVLISQVVAKGLLSSKARGVSLRPVAERNGGGEVVQVRRE